MSTTTPFAEGRSLADAVDRARDAMAGPPPPAHIDVRQVAIELVEESPWNPRKHWVDAADEDLVASLRAHGILTPLLARPVQGPPPAYRRYELAAGHRRLRAAKAAGLPMVPVQIREMGDEEFRQILIVENLQRADIHPLDEADAYHALRQADGAYTPEAIAAKVGKSVSYVYRRLKLVDLFQEARDAYWRNEITAAHAERLARLTDEQQIAALDEACFHDLIRGADDSREPAPISTLDQWIARRLRERPLEDPTTQHYFPALAAELREIQEAEAPVTLLQLSESHHVNVDLGTRKHGALGAGRWVAIRNERDRCDHVKKGVVVHGGPMRIIEVCATKGCVTHFPPRETPATSDLAAKDRAAAAREAEERTHQARVDAQNQWQRLKPTAVAAFAGHVKAAKVTPALVLTLAGHHRADVERAIGGKVTAATVGQALTVLSVIESGLWDRYDFVRATKPHGFDLAAFEKAQAAPTAPRTAASRKPATKAAKRTAAPAKGKARR